MNFSYSTLYCKIPAVTLTVRLSITTANLGNYEVTIFIIFIGIIIITLIIIIILVAVLPLL